MESRYQTYECRILEISDFPHQLEATTTYRPYDPQNSSWCYPKGEKSQSEMILSLGSSGNYGLGSRYQTSGCQILEFLIFHVS